MSYIEHKSKIGTNRSRPRIWIEGKFVTAAGFAPGDRYNVVKRGALLTLVKAEDGERKVTGKGDKPIMDIAGAAADIAPAGTRLRLAATTDTGIIRIRAVKS